MPSPPSLIDRVSRASDDQAFEEWRNLLSPIVQVSPSPDGAARPRGSLTSFMLGDLMVTRMTIDAQTMVRGKALADTTPDHLAIQIYRAGGFSGTLAGGSIARARGTAAMVDLRQTFDMRFSKSDTIGVAVPRRLLDGVGGARLPSHLDPVRDRLLVARISSLYRHLLDGTGQSASEASDDMAAFLRRLLDPSRASDVLQGREIDAGIVALAESVIVANLRLPDLSPSVIASRLGISRATLYRAFAARGGLMRWVWDVRLDAVRAALEDPLEKRPIARLAATYGFKSLSHFSQAFRSRFGSAPRDWRAEHRRTAMDIDGWTVDRMRRWWIDLV